MFGSFVSVTVIRLFEILKMFYPPKGTEGGPIVFTYILVGLGKVYWSFVSVAVIRLLKILKMFYPPKGLCEAEPSGVHLTVFPFYCVWETVFGPFLSGALIRLFKFWKCFIPLRDFAKQNPMGSIWQSFHFIVLGKGVLTFRFSADNPPFQNLENVLYPEGTLRSRTQWGPFDSLSILLC